MQFATHELYGGAFKIDLPTSYADISQIRDVPNHQEVFVDSDADQSVVIELNSMAEVSDADAAMYLFKDLMNDSGAASVNVTNSGPLDLKRKCHYPLFYPVQS